MIRQVKWDKSDIAAFLGCYLSEPKPHIYFDPPEKPFTLARFKQAIEKSGVSLDLKTQLLCHGDTVFINGEEYSVDKVNYTLLRTLADNRKLEATSVVPASALELLYQWYTEGYIFISQTRKSAKKVT